MSSTLEIVRGGKRERYEWNGNDADRETARKAFDEAVGQGMLSMVVDSPGRSREIKSFQDIEDVEKERGTVTVRQTAPLVGG